MPERKPTMQTVKVTDARQQFSELINRVFKERTRVMIEKSGIPVAALISTQELEQFDRLQAQRRRDFAVLDEIGEAFRDVPDAELEREVARAIAQVRAERRREAEPLKVKTPRRRRAAAR